MSLVESLLTAIVRLEGDALVMHVGEKPYVVTTSEAASAYRGPLSWGQVELSTRTLTVDAVAGMLAQLLPEDQRAVLADVGAVEHQLLENPDISGRFVVIAARGGDDIWLEIRRQRPASVASAVEVAEPMAAEALAEEPETTTAEIAATESEETPSQASEPVMEALPEPVAEAAPEPVMEAPPEPVAEAAPEPVMEVPPEPVAEAAPEPVMEASPGPVAEAAPEPVVEAPPEPVAEAAPEPVLESPPEPVMEVSPEPVMEASSELEVVEAAVELEVIDVAPESAAAVTDHDSGIEIELELEPEELVLASAPTPEVRSAMPEAPGREEAEYYDLSSDVLADEALELAVTPLAEQAAVEPVAANGSPDAQVTASPEPNREPTSEPGPSEAPPAQPAVDVRAPTEEASFPTEAPRQAIVLPLTRQGVRGGEREDDGASVERGTLGRLLRVAAARGASALYIVTGSRPVMRVAGEIQVLDAEGAIGASDVATLLMELAPALSREALQKGAVTEWIVDVADAGRVRCMSFRDHRGLGGIFRMLPARALSVEQLGLSREIQGLCRESDGFVLVTGPRASGKSTLVSAFVDLINRTRADHVITFEGEIKFVHESRRSLVSQRELRGDVAELRAAVRAALREDPDVLVIEDLRSPELLASALEAAESGRLVFGALPAASTVAAIEWIVDQFPQERRAAMLSSLASTLRGVVSQVLLRKIGGGRVAGREILLNTPSVAALIADGQTRQLLPALDTGRRVGMAPLNDALVSFVRSGAVSPAEAYRKSADRDGLLEQLRGERIDTSFVERLA